MIRLICGPKGTGKTKVILDDVNKCVDGAKGDVVFITDKKFDSIRVNFNVRVLYANDYNVSGTAQLRGFIKGLFAGNSDIEYLYIDGLMRIVGQDDDLTAFFEDLTTLEKEYGFKAIITISKAVEELPENVRGYAE